MRTDLTDITLVVDRSGSMHSIREDAQGGINAFVSEQAKLEGTAHVTLVQFDTEYEFIARGIDAREFPEYELAPRGGTALLDAVGRAINETGRRLRKLPEEDRPGLVVIVIMTDGHENSSNEFTLNEIRKMIQHQQDKYNWQFTFLGADQDAFGEATKMGMSRCSAAPFAKRKVGTAYEATSQKVGRMRRQLRGGQTIKNEFTDQELTDMES